jgi:hypothetical protein
MYSLSANYFGFKVSEELSDFVDDISREILDFANHNSFILIKEGLDLSVYLVFSFLLGHIFIYKL